MDLSGCIAAANAVSLTIQKQPNISTTKLFSNAASKLVPPNINLEQITKHSVAIKDRIQQQQQQGKDSDSDSELYGGGSDSSLSDSASDSSSSSSATVSKKRKKSSERKSERLKENKKKQKQKQKKKKKSKSKKKKKNKWKFYDSDGYTDSDVDEDSDLEAMRKPPVVLQPIGLLPRKQAKKQRAFELRNLIFQRTGRQWRCKYCETGDGKMDGLSSNNLRVVYAMEYDLRWSMSRQQFIETIVNKYNELVYEENLINNPTEQIPKLTVEEYELHLYECFEKRDIVSVLWNTNDEIQEQIEYISQTASIMRNPENGSIVVDNKTYRTVSHLYAHMTKNLKMIDEMKRREETARERERTKRAKQQERAGAGFYNK